MNYFIMQLFVLILTNEFIRHAFSWSYSQRSNSLCYNDGKAYRCVPPFLNIIENMLPEEKSIVNTCGQFNKQRICNNGINGQFDESSSCHSCMKNTHTISYLTDTHMNNNITYWASSLIEPGDSVTLTYSFNKLFEIYYVSVIFIPFLEPDSVTIEKSMDDGKTWAAWHYFSKDCLKSFGIQPTESMGYSIDAKAHTMLAKCSPLTVSNDYTSRNNIIAFTTSGSVNGYAEHSKRFINWMTASNVRIILQKFKGSEFHLGFTYPPILKQYFGQFEKENFAKSNETMNDAAIGSKDNQIKPVKYKSPSVLKTYEYFAIADISMGGRCQCYGHAGRCYNDQKDGFKCDCQHQTMGKNCDICKTGYVDKPWAPATSASANECKRCNCNLHSKQCTFDTNLFILSNRQSGGFCDKCQHDTAGRYCHYCAKGFYRDWTKPLSHQHVCIKCRCHPIGSKISNDCDQRTSQCICKEGVTGLSCNRCDKGYQQTRDPQQPCKKNYDPHKIPMAQAPETNCNQCNNKRKRIRFKKYCRKDAVLLVTMQSREQHNNLVRFEMKIQHIWRLNPLKFPAELGNSLLSLSRNSSPLWVREPDLRCGCPSIHLGSSYLLILKVSTTDYLGRKELLLDGGKSVALRWQKTWLRRLNKFSARERLGQCEKFRIRRYRRHGYGV